MTLPNENCPTFFSCQTDLKCSGECTKRSNMTTKNAALIARLYAVSDRITHGDAGIDSVEAVNEAAALLRSQVAEIDLYREKYNGTYGALDDCARSYSLIEDERDQLKAKNEKLAEALKHLAHNAKKSGANMGLALDVAIQALKENT